MDSFTLTSLDGTTIDILISVRSSEQVPAEITGVPDAVEVEPVEGEEPVPNASAEVNINAANVSGMLSITDPNLMEETFVAVEDIATSYGQFSIDESGEWSYTLNTELEVIKAHKGDGVAPDPLMDVATVTSFDGTQVDVPITINGLVGGNLTAEIGGGTADSLFRINMPEGQTLRTGKMTLKVNYAESGTRDAKVIFFGRAFNSDDKRTLAALSMRANGELKLMDGAGSRATFTLDQTHTPGEWFDIAFTWDATPETKNGGKTVISLSINGTPITSSGGQISGEFFESLSIAKFIVDIGMKHMQVLARGNSGPVNVDDYVIYSDVAGTTEIYNQSFDELGEGAAISLDLRNGATKGTIVGPLAKP
jgi:VCBS repeat-containing protein